MSVYLYEGYETYEDWGIEFDVRCEHFGGQMQEADRFVGQIWEKGNNRTGKEVRPPVRKKPDGKEQDEEKINLGGNESHCFTNQI